MNQMEGFIGRDNNPSGENFSSKKSLWLDAQSGILSEPDKGIRSMTADLPYLQMVDVDPSKSEPTKKEFADFGI